MFKAYDYVVGQIIESDDKRKLLQNLQDRMEDYKLDNLNVQFWFAKGVYYLVEV